MSILTPDQIAVYDYDAPSPRVYGIDHDHFRVGQWPTIEFTVKSTEPCVIVEQPTGSGKSAVAKALSKRAVWETSDWARCVTLTRTKSLQDQYGDLYDAHLMKGKGNYRCVHPRAKSWQMADECLYMDSSMTKCPHNSDCPYLIAKNGALFEPFVVTNYAYWLSAFQLNREVTGTHSGIRTLVCDEAHLLSQTTLDWSGTTIHDRHSELYHLPQFPIIRGSERTVSVLDQMFGIESEPESSGLDQARDWLAKAGVIIDGIVKGYKRLAPFTNDEQRKEARNAEMFQNKVESTLAAITHSEDDWYVRAGPTAVNYRGENIAGIVIRPLTARHQFKRLFLGADRTLLMSATIGNPETFSEELGIENYTFRAVPNRFPPESRRIMLLDAPRMGRKSTDKDYEHQADAIAEAINGVDSSWSGIIHVTRKDEAVKLADRLARRGLQDRVWTPPLRDRYRWLGTTDQFEAWQARKEKIKNSIMCCWQFWAGFDGQEERICIVAKTPFPYLGDPYEKARQKYSRSFYNQRTAWELVQALGRTRRGRIEDYDLGGEIKGLVAIADSNYRRVQKYIPVDVKEAMIEWESR